jgi:hypothetical protein
VNEIDSNSIEFKKSKFFIYVWRRGTAKSPKSFLYGRIISSALTLPVEKRFLEILLFGILRRTPWMGNQPLARNALTDDTKTRKIEGAACFNARSVKRQF